DLDRNYASPFGRAAGRVDAATVDAGLRAYMLRIYNYMSIGLAITGLAALGVYMAAVTTDPSGAAAKFGNAFLTPFGYAMYVSPLKWLFILAPLAMVFVISAGIERLKNDYIYGYASQGGDVAERAAITGALSLYLNFINLFTLLLQLLGQRD